MAEKQENYQQLRDELDGILLKIQSGELDIEAAAKEYERAHKIVEKLEKYILRAENKVNSVKLKSI
jgi:exodeoxyribonuclease VII small subunit